MDEWLVDEGQQWVDAHAEDVWRQLLWAWRRDGVDPLTATQFDRQLNEYASSACARVIAQDRDAPWEASFGLGQRWIESLHDGAIRPVVDGVDAGAWRGELDEVVPTWQELLEGLPPAPKPGW